MATSDLAVAFKPESSLLGIDFVRTRFRATRGQKNAPPSVIEKFIAIGVLVYAGTGVATMVLGENFLDYDALEHHFFDRC